MTSILITASLALIAPQPPATPAGEQPRDRQNNAAMKQPSLDGTWTVVCLEKDGKPDPEAKNYTVKAQGNTITCSSQDGKPAMTWKVDFRPNGQIRVTEQNQQGGGSPANREGRPADTANREGDQSKAGVYVLAGDYLAVCLHNTNQSGQGNQNSNDREGKPRSANSTVRDREQNAPHDNDRTGNNGGGSGDSKPHCSVVLKREGNANNNR